MSRPRGKRSCMMMMSLESLNGTCDHELVSSAVLTRMMALHVELSARWDDGYITCHLEVAFVFPKASIYSSWSKSKSQSLCTGMLIRSKWALLDLLRFCCHICSLIRGGSRVYDIKGLVQWAVRCLLLGHPPARASQGHAVQAGCRRLLVWVGCIGWLRAGLSTALD